MKMRACRHHSVRARSRHRGNSLLPAMLFLLVIAMLGLAALSSTVLEERMVGNTKDQNLAFQAAEAGLRDAETDIMQNLSPHSPFSASCANGLCTPPSTWPTATSSDISKLINWSDASMTRQYGSQTTAGTIPLVASQPVYVVEKLSTIPPGAGHSVALGVAPPSSGGTAYRITVLGTGAHSETRVFLQSIFVMRDS
jgi:type IV pilus assembly protein PilX